MMENKRVTWSVLLRRSNYSANKGEIYPEVEVRGTLTMEDIVNAIISARSELRRETYLAVAREIEEMMQSFLVEGYAISTGVGTLTPAVTGPWDFRRLEPEARAKNKATLRYSVSKEMKKKLENPLFKQSGFRKSRLCINHIYNPYLPDAENIASPGDTLKLVGNHLLMKGDHPERGFYFLKADTEEVAAFIPGEKIHLPGRTTTFVQVPNDLPAGNYLLKVVSQCTTSPKILKTPAEYVCPTILQVMPREAALEAAQAQKEEN